MSCRHSADNYCCIAVRYGARHPGEMAKPITPWSAALSVVETPGPAISGAMELRHCVLEALLDDLQPVYRCIELSEPACARAYGRAELQ